MIVTFIQILLNKIYFLKVICLINKNSFCYNKLVHQRIMAKVIYLCFLLLFLNFYQAFIIIKNDKNKNVTPCFPQIGILVLAKSIDMLTAGSTEQNRAF